MLEQQVFTQVKVMIVIFIIICLFITFVLLTLMVIYTHIHIFRYFAHYIKNHFALINYIVFGFIL